MIEAIYLLAWWVALRSSGLIGGDSLLACLPACAVQPLQLVQNAAVWFVFNLPKLSLTLHCSSASCTGYRWLPKSNSRHWYLPTMLQMAQPILRPCTSACHSLITRWHSYCPIKSQQLSALVPQWWEDSRINIYCTPSITSLLCQMNYNNRFFDKVTQHIFGKRILLLISLCYY